VLIIINKRYFPKYFTATWSTHFYGTSFGFIIYLFIKYIFKTSAWRLFHTNETKHVAVKRNGKYLLIVINMQTVVLNCILYIYLYIFIYYFSLNTSAMSHLNKMWLSINHSITRTYSLIRSIERQLVNGTKNEIYKKQQV